MQDEPVEGIDLHVFLDIGSLSEPRCCNASNSAMLPTFRSWCFCRSSDKHSGQRRTVYCAGMSETDVVGRKRYSAAIVEAQNWRFLAA